MKKRIAVLLALSLTATLPCTVMAEDTAEENTSKLTLAKE